MSRVESKPRRGDGENVLVPTMIYRDIGFQCKSLFFIVLVVFWEFFEKGIRNRVVSFLICIGSTNDTAVAM